MPELPEIEAMARTIRPIVAGERISRGEVIHPIVIARAEGPRRKRAVAEFLARVRGQTIRSAERRGKWLVLGLDEGCLVLHFRLDGKLLWFDGPPRGHVDVAWHLGRGTLAYVDPRHLGRIEWLARPEDHPRIAALGPDPLTKTFTPQVLAERLQGSARALKPLLIDPSRIAGLGNIYSLEALWRVRLDPRRPGRSLETDEARWLHKAIVAVLRRALECCLDPEPDFRDPWWWFKGLEKIVRVYGREGEPCTRCGAKIRRIQQGGRSTYACLRCQR